MKKLAVIIISSFFLQVTIGQVATIQDPDGWTNVREKPDNESDIIHKVYENEVFWYDYESTDREQDWISIYILKNDFSLEKSEPNFIVGFIHKSRLLPLKELKPYTEENFSFKYATSEFKLRNRIVDKHEGKWISKFDGRPIWGVDGGYPRMQIDAIDVSIDGIKIQIHKVFYSDIFECDNTFTIYKNKDTYFVHQWNSDGAGAYEIVWVLDKTGLKQRLVGTMI